MPKPTASISLDLDNKWSYLKTHGDEGWEKFPTYLDTVVPRFLDLFERRGFTATVFIVGQDADLQQNHFALKSIADAGHEIGNHSFHHEPWLHLYDRDDLVAEFERSEQAIRTATGKTTVGFRGPGFSISDEVLEVLAERGYQYDGTLFPTFLGPVARAYYFLTAKMDRQEKDKRKLLFGRFQDGFRPNRPFLWDIPEHQLVEIPVTTMPLLKLPIHLSYILYLARYSRLAARAYFWKALLHCRLFGVAPSFLLHPLDFMGKEDDDDLNFFPAMDLPLDFKLNVVNDVFDALQKHYHLTSMLEHAREILEKRQAAPRRDVALVRPAN